jgi:flagellar biosynthesis anti-sigma factor FlgM
MNKKTTAEIAVKPTQGNTTLSGVDPDVRQEKVTRLRAAIASGTYSVTPAELAEKLMQYMLQRA